MKNLSFIVFVLLINLSILGANINGTVKVEDNDSLGVFIYVEGQNKYDISDSKGRFNISGLQIGQEYTLVLQKGLLQDYKKTVKVTSENTIASIIIPSEKSTNKEKVIEKNSESIKDTTSKTSATVKENIKNVGNVSSTEKKTETSEIKAIKISKVNLIGKVNSVLSGDIFLQLSGQSYGIIVKSNGSFKLNLNPGKYTATFIQEGAFTKKVTFNVGKNGTDAGTIVMEAIDFNNLTLNLPEKLENGVVQLYKDGFLEYSSKVDKNSNNILIKGLKKGKYDLVVKAFGKEDFNSEVNIMGNSNVDIKFNDLVKENKIFVNVFPKDAETELRIFDGNQMIKSMLVKDIAVIEGLDSKKTYNVETFDSKYKKNEIKRVSTGDNINLNLVREIKGTVISGYVSPFNSGAKIMVLDKGQILAETTTDETGYYELEFSEKISGEKNIRVSAEDFKDEIFVKNFETGKAVYEKNIMLLPYTTKISGNVSFDKGNSLSNVLVLIEELGIWQFTNSKGEYYFTNLPESEYEITFKKLGYTTKIEKVKATKDEMSKRDVVLNSIGKLVFRSNIEEYKINLNGKELNINSKLYESIQGMGIITVTGTKSGYLPITTKIKLTEAGEIRDIIFDFINIEEQNKMVKSKITKINSDIKELKIGEAEESLNELGKMKSLKSYEKDYLEIKGKLKSAKLRLFDIDRSIKFEIEKVKENIKKSEASKVGYVEKNKNLTKLYKESVDYLEKIILSHPYTTYRYDVNILQSDIYAKLGMPNSAKNAMEEAKKYEGRRKE